MKPGPILLLVLAAFPGSRLPASEPAPPGKVPAPQTAAKGPDGSWLEPRITAPKYEGAPVPPPSGAAILFDGLSVDAWAQFPPKGDVDQPGPFRWKIAGGCMEVVPFTGMAGTRERCITSGHLHLEWATPTEVKGKGQGRGNSGVFIEGLPELQVLDSFANQTYFDGQAAAFYKHSPPLVNASRPPGEWQCYDIHIQRAAVEEGRVTKPAVVTVYHNHVLVQDRLEFASPVQAGRLRLQDHRNPVRFRNIWFRPNGQLSSAANTSDSP